MLSFLFILLAMVVLALVSSVIAAIVTALVLRSTLLFRLAARIRASRTWRRVLPDFALVGLVRLSPVGGGMGNLLIGGGNLYGGTGVPTDAALGGTPANGDFYFRIDGAATTCIYQRRAAAWVATAA